MKNQFLFNIVAAVTFSTAPGLILAQAPTLGTASEFILFSSNGSVSNTGISQLTGNVGTNNGASTAFGNVNGVMHDNNGTSAASATDLLTAYNQLNALTPGFFPSPLLGNGDTLSPGVYSISANAILSNTLNLNAQGNANAEFIFLIQAPFSTNAYSNINLINGAQACKVFWKVEGLVSMATGTVMRGTVIANNAAIEMNSGVTLEGRALSTTGAVSVNGVMAYIPTGCGSPVLTGPAAPALNAVACYAIFTSDGDVTNNGISTITGDIGTNTGLTTGYDSSTVTGSVHPIPDGSTAATSSDLLNVYNYLKLLPYDIELLYPAEFGNNLVLTPHTYLMNAAAVLTDTIFLNARGNSNAVFVIRINGALSTSTYASVSLINGTQSKNVFWVVEGAVDLNDYTNFKGTIISNNGAMNLMTGTILDGRALSTTGAVSTSAINTIATSIPTNCLTVGIPSINEKSGYVRIYPNPYNRSFMINIKHESQEDNSILIMFNVVGARVMRIELNKETTTVETNLPSGVYLYQVTGKNGIIQTGRVISQ